MFWVVDNFLMKKHRTKAKLEEREEDSRGNGKVRYRRALSHDDSESEVSVPPVRLLATSSRRRPSTTLERDPFRRVGSYPKWRLVWSDRPRCISVTKRGVSLSFKLASP